MVPFSLLDHEMSRMVFCPLFCVHAREREIEREREREREREKIESIMSVGGFK